jgi:hypothetical protein
MTSFRESIELLIKLKKQLDAAELSQSKFQGKVLGVVMDFIHGPTDLMMKEALVAECHEHDWVTEQQYAVLQAEIQKAEPMQVIMTNT